MILFSDKCGVDITDSIVRRERMGHIELACPESWMLENFIVNAL